MKKLAIVVPFFLFLILNACPNGAPDIPPEDTTIIHPVETVLITGQAFSHPVQVIGSTYNGLVIENCVFDTINGNALTIKGANNVTVRNCTFTDIVGNGVYLDGTTATMGITIKGNTLTNIWGNGINVKEAHRGVTVEGNTIITSGIDLQGAAKGAPHHGIYMMGSGHTITANTIHTVKNPNGHGISVRSNGTISANKVSYTDKSGIGYYSDHPATAGALLIENNWVYKTTNDGISIVSNGERTNLIDSAVIRFNTVVTDNKACIKLGDNSHSIEDIDLHIYGNLLVRLGIGDNYIWDNGGTASIQLDSHNKKSNSDPGFVDLSNGDLSITKPADWATTAVSGAPEFPVYDIDGDTRANGFQYVGAHDPD